MRPNGLRDIFARGGRAINGWVTIGSSYAAELMAHQTFDSVTIDLQHGPVDFETSVGMLQAISTTAAVPMVRVPWNEPAMTGKLLDAGAYGVICPMINTREEAEALVRACRYPPDGMRSFGPHRAALYGGPDYWKYANREILIFAMVETRQAVGNLDAILAVNGIDGIYVGPADLSFSLGKPPRLDPEDSEVLATLDAICRQTRARGKIAGVHVDGARTALRRYGEGYQLCSIGTDALLLAKAARSAVDEIRSAATA
jgi:4-hydroxy-2-oxoheptanedioate aldolase